MPDWFYVIDAMNMLVRQYHSPGLNLTAPSGQPTKAIYLFTQAIVEILRKHNPAYLAVCWDGPREYSRRRKIHPGYKESRKPPDTDLISQRDIVHQILHEFRVASLEVKDAEADDIIATLATSCVSDEVHVAVLSTDKDLGCLTKDPRVKLHDFFSGRWSTAKEVEEKWGVKPSQMTDLLSLAGDSCDDIPGVEGWGEKTAAKYLRQYKSLNATVEAAADGLIPTRLGDNLLKAVSDGTVEICRKLVTLDRAVEIKVSEEELLSPKLSEALTRAEPIFRKLGFKSLLR